MTVGSGMAEGATWESFGIQPRFSADGEITWEVEITRNGVNVPNLYVSVCLFGNSVLCECVGDGIDGQDAITDANGLATFTLYGGGCLDWGILTLPDWIKLEAPFSQDGVVDIPLLVPLGWRSPDPVSDLGIKFGEFYVDPHTGEAFPWDPTECKSGLSDAVYLTFHIKTGSSDFCSDLNGTGAVDVGDATLVTRSLKFSHFCPRTTE